MRKFKKSTKTAKSGKIYEVEYLAIFRAHKSQYVGEWQYQIEALVNGEKVVMFETATSIKQARGNFEWHFYNIL